MFLIRKLALPLHKNSLSIMTSSLFNAGIGYAFWILAARSYTQVDVGLGTAIISSLTLLSLFSRLGLDHSLLRFVPGGNSKSIIYTTVLVAAISSAILGSAYIIIAGLISAELIVIQDLMTGTLFVLFLVLISIAYMTGYGFIALRSSRNYLLQNAILGARLPLLLFASSIGYMGILYSVGISYLLAVCFSFLVLMQMRFCTMERRICWSYLKTSFNFSSTNYLVSLLSAAPLLILPLIVLNVMGPAQTAEYYIAYTITSLLFIIPGSVSASLLVEGSYGKSLRIMTIESLKLIMIILTPAVVSILVLGNYLLGFIGSEYSDAIVLLRYMALSGFLVAISSTFFSVKRVQKDMRSVMIMSIFFCASLFSSCYILMIRYGLTGIGYGWLFSYSLLAIASLVIMKNDRIIL